MAVFINLAKAFDTVTKNNWKILTIRYKKSSNTVSGKLFSYGENKDYKKHSIKRKY